MARKVVIIGGVAGGASTAARLRRLSEDAQIVLLERGEHISYANCGLPYYIGGVIEERENLFVMTPEKFKERHNVDVRICNEVLSIDRAAKKVAVLNRNSGEKYYESYDYLVLSPGAEPLKPPLPGIDSEGIFSLRSVNDTDRIYGYMAARKPRRALVVGAGYIGLEMAENLSNRGLQVTVVELAPQVLSPIDSDMAAGVQQYLRLMGVKLVLGTGVAAFYEQTGSKSLQVELSDSSLLETDMIILSIGVKPESRLAAEAGLEVNRGIKVNDRMQTSDPAIFAIGDAVEVTHLVTGKQALIPLAGPANKQGRIAANNISGRDDRYKGTQGTAVLKVFEMTVAATGANEQVLKNEGLKYEKIIIHPNGHAGYYPGASPLSLKLLFSRDGTIFGAQATGFSGVEKRIDVLAAALRAGLSVYDLQELELSYAPPYSSAKDPVNMAGFVASNLLDGDYFVINSSELLSRDTGALQLLDVREPEEFELGSIPGAVNIPLGSLRERSGELDSARKTAVYCATGLRSYLALRTLKLRGFKDVRNLNGGYVTYRAIEGEQASDEKPGEELLAEPTARPPAAGLELNCAERVALDLCGLQCPGPIMQIFKKMQELPDGAVLEAIATDPGFAADIEAWCRRTGNTLLDKGHNGKAFTAVICKGSERAGENVESLRPDNGVSADDKTIVVFSGDLDKTLASLIIANGAAAMGRKVTLFFTFWGLNVLRRPERVKVKKSFMDSMFGKMMPRGSKKLGLSKMNMAGMGPKMIRMVMKNKNVDSLEVLLEQALQNGVRLVACQMSMDIMGIKREELLDGVELGGVATYLDAAENSNVNLFI